MLKRLADTASALLIASIAIAAPAQQTPASAPIKVPTFDVISVKPNHGDFHGISLGYTPDGIRATNIPILFVIKEAFGLNDDQLFGIPDWAHSEKYDIEAKVADADVPSMKGLTHDQRRQMLLQILADRFKLTYHRETRILPEYTLVIAKGGSKLTEFSPGNDASGQPKRGGQMKMQNGIITANGVPMEPWCVCCPIVLVGPSSTRPASKAPTTSPCNGQTIGTMARPGVRTRAPHHQPKFPAPPSSLLSRNNWASNWNPKKVLSK